MIFQYCDRLWYCDIMWNIVNHILWIIFWLYRLPGNSNGKIWIIFKKIIWKKWIWKKGILNKHVNVSTSGTSVPYIHMSKLTYPDVGLDVRTVCIKKWFHRWYRTLPYGTVAYRSVQVLFYVILSYLDIRLTILWLPYVCDCDNECWNSDDRMNILIPPTGRLIQVNFGHEKTFF